MLLMKDRSFLYELRGYLIYAKVGERSFFYDLRAYLTYVEVGETSTLYLSASISVTMLFHCYFYQSTNFIGLHSYKQV